MTAGIPTTVRTELVIHTDELVIRGRIRVPVQSLARTLSGLPDGILELDDATIEEHRSIGRPVAAPVVHVRADSIVVALSTPALEAEDAAGHPSVLLAVPPFEVTGRLAVLPADEPIRTALRALPRTGFVSVTSAAYWSDSLNESRRRVSVAAVNAARIQAVMPHEEVDPWAGLDTARAIPG